MPEVTMNGALNEALRRSLADDERMLVFGEDVGRLGGVFRITDGLQQEFGERRVFDTPLAESAIAGVAVGLAMAGWHPVVEMQFDSFSYPALNQVVNHVAKYRNRTRGIVSMPIVVRMPVGGSVGAAENHSDSPEGYYAQTPGLKVVIPSSAVDAYALLRASIADPDPVVFLEPKSRYWVKEDGDLDAPGALPIGRARVVREGTDCTVIAYGAMVARALAAADRAAGQGTSVEVVDLRSLVPLDITTMAASVARTGRAVVVHEAPISYGPGAEVSARIVEECFDHLEAPVARVAGHDIPYPPATMEQHHVPTNERIMAAIARTVRY
ncbi:MAG TPA: alpha-ketoacid dehydrogenase subunit beta [Actinomycetota bacterium]|nr:alpha-ketoacid dehydrogenase subunit beta [Actinomycetota bacterium]